MRSNPQSLRKNTKAASPAVSAVIITAATVVLVLVSSLYALQVLTRQQAQAEYETMQNSILAFDDALRDIAWDPEGTRSVRFTAQYGNMLLIGGAKNYTISADGLNDTFHYSFTTAVVKYQMPYGYGVSGSGTSYILGDEHMVVGNLTESFGQAKLEHGSEFASVTLNYRVRVSNEGPIYVASEQTTYNYVDIFVIRLKSESLQILNATDFDLICKNVGLETVPLVAYSEHSSYVYSITDSTAARITVSDDAAPVGTEPDYINLTDLPLDQEYDVIFNLIIADVRVST